MSFAYVGIIAPKYYNIAFCHCQADLQPGNGDQIGYSVAQRKLISVLFFSPAAMDE